MKVDVLPEAKPTKPAFVRGTAQGACPAERSPEKKRFSERFLGREVSSVLRTGGEARSLGHRQKKIKEDESLPFFCFFLELEAVRSILIRKFEGAIIELKFHRRLFGSRRSHFF